MRAVIRWIDQDNAHSLGYFGYGKDGGTWVLETGDDEHVADLSATRMDAAQREAEAVLGSPPAFWRELRGNYGHAYVTEIENR